MFGNHQVFLTAFIVMLVDRALKSAVSCIFIPETRLVILKNILSIYYIENTGAAFGILKDNIVFLSVFSFITILSISVYFLFSSRDFSLYQKISWGLILGGSAGNFVDRAFSRTWAVTDFISLDFINFAVFNPADIAITVGVVMVIISLLGAEDILCRFKK